jgi:hypothetical protein
VSYYKLVRIYGCVEPTVFQPRIDPDDDALHEALIEHLKEESYKDEDALFYLYVPDDPKEAVELLAFGASYMEDVLEEVDK